LVVAPGSRRRKRTQARRNAMGVGLVFEADLHSNEHESHWVLQGVSLSLNIDT